MKIKVVASRCCPAAANERALMSSEHFSWDGTLLEACASLKSFQRKDAKEEDKPDDPGNPAVNFHGQKRRNETHASTTDREALLARKGTGKEARLSYSGNAPMDNRYGLAAEVEVLQADGLAERAAAVVMVTSMEDERKVTGIMRSRPGQGRRATEGFYGNPIKVLLRSVADPTRPQP